MPRRSPRSVKRSTTSPHTSSTGRATRPKAGSLERLIDGLPPDRRENVFTHSSWAPDRASSYERLEFLGDSVLELAIARELYERYPDYAEGQLAKIRSHVVSRASCAVVARELGLGERLADGGASVPRAELDRLARNGNVLAALLEAALGALFLEKGFQRIEPAIVEAFAGRIEYALTTYVDHKTELQEALARAGSGVTYTVLDVEGPPHDRTFTSAAVIDGVELGVGKGASKKAAEQEAARQALAKIAEASGAADAAS
jgi:ribonuclease III